MKSISVMSFLLYMESSAQTQSQVPAFLGAEGYGAQSERHGLNTNQTKK